MPLSVLCDVSFYSEAPEEVVLLRLACRLAGHRGTNGSGGLAATAMMTPRRIMWKHQQWPRKKEKAKRREKRRDEGRPIGKGARRKRLGTKT